MSLEFKGEKSKTISLREVKLCPPGNMIEKLKCKAPK